MTERLHTHEKELPKTRAVTPCLGPSLNRCGTIQQLLLSTDVSPPISGHLLPAKLACVGVSSLIIITPEGLWGAVNISGACK